MERLADTSPGEALVFFVSVEFVYTTAKLAESSSLIR
jgi:hypothetical protein